MSCYYMVKMTQAEWIREAKMHIEYGILKLHAHDGMNGAMMVRGNEVWIGWKKCGDKNTRTDLDQKMANETIKVLPFLRLDQFKYYLVTE